LNDRASRGGGNLIEIPWFSPLSSLAPPWRALRFLTIIARRFPSRRWFMQKMRRRQGDRMANKTARIVWAGSNSDNVLSLADEVIE
jgi:hypothetical protein